MFNHVFSFYKRRYQGVLRHLKVTQGLLKGIEDYQDFFV